jgi:hypothetical protein
VLVGIGELCHMHSMFVCTLLSCCLGHQSVGFSGREQRAAKCYLAEGQCSRGNQMAGFQDYCSGRSWPVHEYRDHVYIQSDVTAAISRADFYGFFKEAWEPGCNIQGPKWLAEARDAHLERYRQ